MGCKLWVKVVGKGDVISFFANAKRLNQVECRSLYGWKAGWSVKKVDRLIADGVTLLMNQIISFSFGQSMFITMMGMNGKESK